MNHSNLRKKSPIAIVGVSALFPGSIGAGSFWKNIVDGKDLITDVPETHWKIEDYYDPNPANPDKIYCKRGAFLSKIEFDTLEYGIPPSILPATDTSQLMSLVVANQLLKDAWEGQFTHISKDRVSVILGNTSGSEMMYEAMGRLRRPVWERALREQGIDSGEIQQICDRISSYLHRWEESTFPGLLGNVVAGRIANRLDLGGTNCIVDAACASSLSAISMGIHELHLGDSDLVLTGGVDALNGIFSFMCFSKTPALSPSGDCRPFSDKADGTLLGEGIAMFALRRLKDAEQDGDKIYAVIHGIGTSSDGRAKSVYAPRPEGQAKALMRAYENAGYGPETVELVEAHGTGTKAGDSAEVEGLLQVFNSTKRLDRQWCALGSVKSQIGHTKGAAGAAGLFKATLALHQKVLPPTIKVDRPNSELNLNESPFYLNTQVRPWLRNPSYPRRASVSAFGFGGSNFHLTLEEYSGSGKRPLRFNTSTAALILLTGQNISELMKQCQTFAQKVRSSEQLQYFAWETQRKFSARVHSRLAIIAKSDEDLREKLIRASERLEQVQRNEQKNFSEPSGIFYSSGPVLGGIAFLFPGQGSQYLNMGRGIAIDFEVAQQVLDSSNEILTQFGIPFGEVVFPKAAFTEIDKTHQSDQLQATQVAQPAIGAISLAYFALMKSLNIVPQFVAGHSFGEVTALHAAGVLSEKDFLKIAIKRGGAMALAAGTQKQGAMLAVTGNLEQLKAELYLWENQVTIANYNSPTQIVLSGDLENIAQVQRHFEQKGVIAKRLPVSQAFHSPTVAGACQTFFEDLRQISFSKPKIGVFSNSEACLYPEDPDQIRHILAHAIMKPVRFVEQIEAMYEAGARTFIEVGPNSILSRLVEQCLGKRPHMCISLDKKGVLDSSAFWSAAGQMAVHGLIQEFSHIWQGVRPPAEPEIKEKRSTTVVEICGTPYAKKYPSFEPIKIPEIKKKEEEMKDSIISQKNAQTLALSIEQLQRQAAEAHATFQKTLADSHQAYLKIVETGMAALMGRPSEIVNQGQGTEFKSTEKIVATPLSVPSSQSVTPLQSSTSQTPVQSPIPQNDIIQVSIKNMFLDIVSEKTGYPIDVLGLDMELESSLGIDSIKRVEIFSAITERIPNLPEIKPAEVANLRTIGEIIRFIETHQGGTEIGELFVKESKPEVSPSTPSYFEEKTVTSLAIPKFSSTLDIPQNSIKDVFLGIVSEKTGYPIDVLGLDMELESSLGIDSIKRVEIFSAMMERIPNLPEIKPVEAAQLRTLGEIVTFIEGRLGIISTLHNSAQTSSLEFSSNTPSASKSDSEPNCLERFEIRTRERSAPGWTSHQILTTQNFWIIDDGMGIAHALSARLSSLGIQSTISSQILPVTQGVIFLGGLRNINNSAEAIAINKEAFEVARTFASRVKNESGVFITVQDTGGDFGLSGSSLTQAWLGGLAGLAKTALQEWPQACVRAIDIERGSRSAEEIAKILCDELFHGGLELEVGLKADGKRITLISASVSKTLQDEPTIINQESVIIATGGARGVTATAILELARVAKPRIALFGRTSLVDEPNYCKMAVTELELKQAFIEEATKVGEKIDLRQIGKKINSILAAREVQQTLKHLKDAGSEVIYFPINILDSLELSSALDLVRHKWGPITGLIHGAGVLADKSIQDKTQAQFDSVFDTKVEGLRNLLDITKNDPLNCICLFSSVAARVGNTGQVDYAMANEILNKVASAEAKRRGPSCIVKSLNWGPWEGGMVTSTLKKHFEKRGITLIPLKVGARAFVSEISQLATHSVEIVLGANPEQGLTDRLHFTNNSNSERSFQFRITHRSHPHLIDHTINDFPVIPAVMVMDWMISAAEYSQPEKVAQRCENLKVLKGIKLTQFNSEGHEFVIHCDWNHTNSERIFCKLLSSDGTLHYKGEVIVADDRPIAGFPTVALDERQFEWPWSIQSVYDQKILFHGPSFQAIRELYKVTDTAAEAELFGTADLGWPGRTGITDPALFDGALQVSLLLGFHKTNQVSLPTAIQKAIFYHPQLAPKSRARSRVKAVSMNSRKMVLDFDFIGDEGQLISEWKGVEIHFYGDKQVLEAVQ